MPARELVLVPQPQKVSWQEGSFILDAGTVIALLPGSGEQAFFTAKLLQQEIARHSGLELAIVKTAQMLEGKAIMLAADSAALGAFVGEEIAAGDWQTHGSQAYRLQINPQRVLVWAGDGEALHYAVQTLRQITRTNSACWPCMDISDWPALAQRGLMLDVARGKVPTLATIKLLIDQLSLYKMNVLQFYTEHTFVFPHHPRIGQDCGSLSAEDILELEAYAEPRYVQIMPNLQSFGHCEHILNLPEYTPLAESAAHWSLCPVDERTYAFIDDLYGDLLPAFASKTLNIGCDETFDLGKGRSHDQVQTQGIGRVYLGHILKLREIAARYGCKIQLWGDIMLHHPELVTELPEDVTLLDWHYEAADDYPSTRLFGASGRPFWVCPGTSSWNTLFPRIDNANGNIRTLARLGAANGANGFLNTDWGDGGHYQPIGQCWYGYIYGAEQAWTGGQTEDKAFDSRFGRLFFGPAGVSVVEAIRELGRLNTLPGMARPNASRSVFALLDEPLVGPTANGLPAETLDEILAVTSQVEAALCKAYAGSYDPVSIEELIYTTRLLGYTARKIRASQQARRELADLPQEANAAIAALQRIDASLASLILELTAFESEFRAQWLRRARHSEIRISLNHFSKLQARFSAARIWVSEQIEAIRAGAAPDGSLNSYQQAAASYEILYEGWIRHLKEIGITWD